MRQLGRGVIPGKLLGEGKGEERSPASGDLVCHGDDGDCVAEASVRSGIPGRPEHRKAAARLREFSSYAAGLEKRPEGCARSNRNVEEGEARGRSADESEGKGSWSAVLSLADTSFVNALVPLVGYAPWIGMPPWVGIPPWDGLPPWIGVPPLDWMPAETHRALRG